MKSPCVFVLAEIFYFGAELLFLRFQITSVSCFLDLVFDEGFYSLDGLIIIYQTKQAELTSVAALLCFIQCSCLFLDDGVCLFCRRGAKPSVIIWFLVKTL